MIGTMWWSQLGSMMASLMFVYAMIQQYFPHDLSRFISRYGNKILSVVYPYIQITFNEYNEDRFNHSRVFLAIQNYLSAYSTSRVKRLMAHDVQNSKCLVLTMDDNQEISEVFQGTQVWWTSGRVAYQAMTTSQKVSTVQRRYYKLTFQRRHRDLIINSYINHVMKQGQAIAVRNRQRKLFTNGSTESWYGGKWTNWSFVHFEHPACFDTLAMDPKRKQEIIDDLLKFKNGKEYYAKIGKAWKRGYLLYGPPGTGKSTMIAAIANFLDYDVYDLELTAVKNNTDLRILLNDTSNKSIIVIEDIDCSLNLTGQRNQKTKYDLDDSDESDHPDDDSVDSDEEEEQQQQHSYDKDGQKIMSKVTLSGLLNFIDGIWSACGGERLIVFTTNHVDKFDPALIRRGRMDKHIELSYCCFEGFKVLAKNYLGVASHDLFSTIERLLEEVNMTPADVAENLMPKSDTEDADDCLKNLVKALQKAKEKALRKKAKEEKKLKGRKEKKLKARKGEKLEEGYKQNSAKEAEDVKANETLPKEVKNNGLVT